MFLFFPVNIKSAREPYFLGIVHGYFFAFTGTSCRKFTGKLLRSRALFWTFSRALFVGSRAKIFEIFTGTFRRSRALFAQKYQKTQNLGVHGQFLQVHGDFFLKMFTGNFEIHGHFFYCSRALFRFTGKFICKRSRANAKCSRALLRICSRALFRGSREKKTLVVHARGASGIE